MPLTTRNPQPISYTHPKSPISEAYRTVRTNIQFTSAANDIRVIMFTSAQPSEGKTSTSTNVGVVTAQAGKRVLLIDADLRKPQVHHRFQISNLDGLSNILIKESQPADCIVAAKIPNLFILPSGPIPPNPSELLSSRMFDHFIESCRDDYDLIILDSPPVLSVTDALVTSQQSDGVVFVVDAQKTNRNLAKKSIVSLQQVGAKVLGVVLNRVNRKHNEYAYSYYAADESASL